MDKSVAKKAKSMAKKTKSVAKKAKSMAKSMAKNGKLASQSIDWLPLYFAETN